MRIWILQAYDQPGGQSTRSEFFAEAFLKHGHEVHFFTNSYCHYFREHRVHINANHLIEKNNGYHIVWLKSLAYKSNIGRLLNMFENMWRILKASKEISNAPDVIIAPSVPPLTALAGLLLSRKFKSKLVYEVRDVWPEALIRSGAIGKYNPISIFFSFLEKLFFKKSHLIVSTLGKIHHYARSKGAQDDKVIVIPNGLSKKVKSKPTYKKKIFKPGKINVTYIGQYGVVHDVLVFIKAAQILQYNKEIHFNFFGDGVTKEACENFVKNNGIKNVTFFDVVPSHEIMAIQDQSDILVAGINNSKHFRYGLNLNKIMYYVASGKPIVFAGDEKPPIIKDYDLGFCCDTGDWKGAAGLIKKISEMSNIEKVNIVKRANEAFDNEICIDALSMRYNQALVSLHDKIKK